MANIAGYGLQIQISASFTFPGVGFTITQLADDSDPFDLPPIQVADKSMGVNGDLLTWTRANPFNVNIAVVPNSKDDINLSILLQANRAGRGKKSVNDIITMTGIYPDGHKITCIQGAITDGMLGNSVASAGRLKTKTYSFTFENVVFV